MNSRSDVEDTGSTTRKSQKVQRPYRLDPFIFFYLFSISQLFVVSPRERGWHRRRDFDFEEFGESEANVNERVFAYILIWLIYLDNNKLTYRNIESLEWDMRDYQAQIRRFLDFTRRRKVFQQRKHKKHETQERKHRKLFPIEPSCFSRHPRRPKVVNSISILVDSMERDISLEHHQQKYGWLNETILILYTTTFSSIWVSWEIGAFECVQAQGRRWVNLDEEKYAEHSNSPLQFSKSRQSQLWTDFLPALDPNHLFI